MIHCSEVVTEQCWKQVESNRALMPVHLLAVVCLSSSSALHCGNIRNMFKLIITCDLISDCSLWLSTTDRWKAQLMRFPPAQQEPCRQRSKRTCTHALTHTRTRCAEQTRWWVAISPAEAIQHGQLSIRTKQPFNVIQIFPGEIGCCVLQRNVFSTVVMLSIKMIHWCSACNDNPKEMKKKPPKTICCRTVRTKNHSVGQVQLLL